MYKYALPLILLIGTALSVDAKTVKEFEFRGFKFGSVPNINMNIAWEDGVKKSAFDSMENIHLYYLRRAWPNTNMTKTYRLKDEYDKIGSVRVKEVYYHYFDNKLSRITINLGMTSCDNIDLVIAGFERKFDIKFDDARVTRYDQLYVEKNVIYKSGSYEISARCVSNQGGEYGHGMISVFNPLLIEEYSNYSNRIAEEKEKNRGKAEAEDL